MELAATPKARPDGPQGRRDGAPQGEPKAREECDRRQLAASSRSAFRLAALCAMGSLLVRAETRAQRSEAGVRRPKGLEPNPELGEGRAQTSLLRELTSRIDGEEPSVLAFHP